MHPTNEHSDQERNRARVAPPGSEPSFDASATGQPPAPAASHDPGRAEPPSSYPPPTAPGQPATAYPMTHVDAETATGYTPAESFNVPTSMASSAAPADPVVPAHALGSTAAFGGASAERTLELREEQLVARKDLREAGEITVRTVVEEVPGRLEVEAQREEVEIEHEPVGQIVSERVGPYEEDGVLVVPIYEEQLVVVKRLMLKENLRVRRVASTEHQCFEDTLRRDRLVIEDPNNTHLVHEQYPTADGGRTDHDDRARAEHEETGPLGQLMRKVLG
ncbi:MAG TPA: DUF2382 domain-containing protein [Chloroflexota bacterium]|nr:DUF2382 domain-containing protein [Chloroflexota bacterium]